MTRRTTLMALLTVLLAGSALALPGPDLLILTPGDLAPAAERLAKARRAEGLGVRVERVDGLVRGGRLDPRVVKALVALCRTESGGVSRYLLLMGDVPAPGDPRGLVRIPAKVLPAEYADERWAYPKELLSDIWYGMLDADLVPELSVGRLPADDLDEANALVDRVLAYERSRDFGAWRKSLEIVAGTAGFGKLADSLIEGTFRRYVSTLIDPAFDVRIVWANPESPFGYVPRLFAEKVLQRFNAGSLVATYVGHGRPHDFASFTWRGKRYPIFGLREARRIEVKRGAPIVVLLACSTGWIDHRRRDCISEVMIKRPGGPIAVFSSTRISQPYADGIVGRELIRHLLSADRVRLGDVLQEVRKALANPSGADQKMIDAMASLIMRPETLAPCREDHIHLYNLLGDPTMVVGVPRGKVALRAPENASLGETIEIRGTLDRELRGTATVTLEGKRGQILRPLVPTEGLEGEALDRALATNWKRANDPVLARVEVEVRGRELVARLGVPEKGVPKGEVLLKVFVEGETGCAIGAAKIRLRRSR
jgi:hypothetical protein